MKRLVVREHERISVGVGGRLSSNEAGWLQRFDENHARRTGDTIFSWSRSSFVVARGYVGVVQLPDLVIEILPKTDTANSEPGAQRNLLYMLSVAGLVHTRSRALAEVHSENAPLLDVFVRAFSDGLLELLAKGLDRAYVTLEENLQVVRGRLVVHEHVRRNSIQKQNVFVRFDELSVDTPVNRTLKAACRILARATRSSAVLRRLRELLDRFADVADVEPTQLGQPPALTRQNASFEPFLEFARRVLAGASPSPSAGDDWSFSVLFAMPQVFEAFVAQFIRRHAAELGLSAVRMRIQARGRHLMSTGSRRLFELRPDLVGVTDTGATVFVLDTKWKLLGPGDPAAAVDIADAYQLFAYGERFDAPLCILLYPGVRSALPHAFRFEGTSRTVRIATLDVCADLKSGRAELIRQLQEIVRPGEPDSTSTAATRDQMVIASKSWPAQPE